MAIGPGKYDDLCTEVREKANALGAVVIVFQGDRGHGFSCQADERVQKFLPGLLELVAQQMRAETNTGAKQNGS